jgi:hypothetical protein
VADGQLHTSGATVSRRVIGLIAGAVLGAAAALTLAAPSAAFAEGSTSIVFGESSQTVDFGSDWYEMLTVTSEGRTLDGPDGTVDVYADGATTPFVGGITLYRGGTAYLTPRITGVPLAAGTHTLTAIFRPASGTSLVSSQTATPLSIIVTPLRLTATAKLDPDAVRPTVRLALSGPYVAALTTPTGRWTVVAADAAGRSVFRATVSQPAGDGTPIGVDLGSKLSPGDSVKISATFAASADAASGATLTQPDPLTLRLPELTVGQVLGRSVPWWTLGLAGGVILAAAAWLVVALVRLRKTPPGAPETGQSAPLPEA